MTTKKTTHAHHTHDDPLASLSDAAKAVAQPFIDGFKKLKKDDKAATLAAIGPICQAEAEREMGMGDSA